MKIDYSRYYSQLDRLSKFIDTSKKIDQTVKLACIAKITNFIRAVREFTVWIFLSTNCCNVIRHYLYRVKPSDRTEETTKKILHIFDQISSVIKEKNSTFIARCQT